MKNIEEIKKKIKNEYEKNNCLRIFYHSLDVANEAKKISIKYNIPLDIIEKIYLAALLHDIGGIYPIEDRIKLAEKFNIKLFDEEKDFPLIIHQKLSKYIAKNYFEINDKNILNSIECHTTLKERYQIEDLIVFLADKIAWDQKGEPPYLKKLLNMIDNSLEEASLYYINYIIAHDIKVIHPWLLEAKKSLEKNISKGLITTISNKTYGPQSIITIYKKNNIKVIRKEATDRGKQELIDQVKFYNTLPLKISHLFPKIIDFNISLDPVYFEYKYINYVQFRTLLVNNKLSIFWLNKLSAAIIDMMKLVHSVNQTKGTIDYVQELYINRCRNRIKETKQMLNLNLLDMKIEIDGKIYNSFIDKIIIIFENNIYKLIPKYLCSTHGQLGPAHIFLSQNTNRYKLIDPKGFDKLHDPLIDLCKIGKAMLYGTEWLEDKKYSLKYSINNDTIIIHDFKMNDFDFVSMKEKYNYFLKKVGKEISIENLNERLSYMILADLIGGLPFAYKTNGEERVVALLILINRAYRDLGDLQKEK